MKWYLKALKQYADFSGRARRTEYWMFVLFNFIFSIVAMGLDVLLGLSFGGNDEYGSTVFVPYGFIYVIYALAMLIPGLAVGVRRLHDVGKSGWMMLIVLIPLIGPIWLLVLYFTDSQDGSNKWGDNPKSDGTEGLLEPQV